MPIGGPSFSKVRKAREALKERSEEVIRLYFETWKLALAAGDYETAQKCASDLAKHLPKDDEGLTVFDSDVDKKIEPKDNNSRPMIQIGVALGGLNKALPEPVVQVIDIPPDGDSK